jgi:hypothetical protein
MIIEKQCRGIIRNGQYRGRGFFFKEANALAGVFMLGLVYE